ncbi:hypothetical protein AB4K20DRAFT_1870188 [Rhizopus microsporus]
MTEITVRALLLHNKADKNGEIIEYTEDTSMPIFRSFIAKRLGLFVPLNEILIYDLKQKELTDMESIRQQEIIYISVLGGIKDKIPGPRKLPFIGNIYDLLPNLIEGLKGLFDNYGPIIDVSLFETRIISTNDPVIAEAFAKESEFITKIISGGLQEIKEFAGSGLFTSNTSDPDWQLAHKLLMPAFSPRANITEQKLEELFLPNQTVSSRILRDPQSGISRGIGFARMTDREAAVAIIEKFNGHVIEGSSAPLQVRFADSPAQKKLKSQSAARRRMVRPQPIAGFSVRPLMPITPETMLGFAPAPTQPYYTEHHHLIHPQ